MFRPVEGSTVQRTLTKLYEIIRNYTKLPSDSIATSRKIL